MKFADRKEQRLVTEVMSGLLSSIKEYCDENTRTAIRITLGILTDTEIETPADAKNETNDTVKSVKCVSGQLMGTRIVQREMIKGTEWIPFGERHPEDGEKVLIVYGGTEVIAKWDLMRGCFYDTQANNLDNTLVTAWMPYKEYTELLNHDV